MRSEEEIRRELTVIEQALLKLQPTDPEYKHLYDVRRALIWVLNNQNETGLSGPSKWTMVKRILSK